MKKIIGSDKKN